MSAPRNNVRSGRRTVDPQAYLLAISAGKAVNDEARFAPFVNMALKMWGLVESMKEKWHMGTILRLYKVAYASLALANSDKRLPVHFKTTAIQALKSLERLRTTDSEMADAEDVASLRSFVDMFADYAPKSSFQVFDSALKEASIQVRAFLHEAYASYSKDERLLAFSVLMGKKIPSTLSLLGANATEKQASEIVISISRVLHLLRDGPLMESPETIDQVRKGAKALLPYLVATEQYLAKTRPSFTALGVIA